MRSAPLFVLVVSTGFVLACCQEQPGSSSAPCTAEALVQAATRDSGANQRNNLRATDFACSDGYARATLETTATLTDPSTALFRDEGGTWSMITNGSAIWGCPQPGLPDDICHTLLGE